MAYYEKLSEVTGVIILHPLTITFVLLTSSYPVTYNVPLPFWFIILASFILSIIFLLLQNRLNEKVLLYLLFLLDIPLIGVMVHYSGGVESMYPFLYMVLVIVAAIFLYRNGAYIVSLITVVFFLGLLLFTSRGSAYSLRYVMNRFYLFSLLFLFTAILSGGLAERYKRKLEEVRRLRLTTEEIIKNLPSGIITIDNHGEIVFTNIPDDARRSAVQLYLARFLKDPQLAKSTELKIKNRYYFLSCTRLYDAQGVLGVLQDLTDIRKLEESSRIAQQTKILAELGGSLAHEIRNPLASIRGSLEVIAKTEKDKKIQHFVNMALKESIRLNEIVTDFLNFAQFRPRRMNRVLISEIITETILETSQRFRDRNLTILRQDADFFVLADPGRLKSGFVNILDNAYEASKDGQKIIIKTYKRKNEGIVEISDQGHGISKPNLKKIFQPFYTTKKGGTGLGLAIAQKVFEAHKGCIEVVSKIGKGTTFTIILPLA